MCGKWIINANRHEQLIASMVILGMKDIDEFPVACGACLLMSLLIGPENRTPVVSRRPHRAS